MGYWPFGQRGGVTVAAYSSLDPMVCAHQAVRLKTLLAQYAGQHEYTCMILDRLEISYLNAGRFDDAARAHSDKVNLKPPTMDSSAEGTPGKLRQWWQAHESEARFRHGQLIVNEALAELNRQAPWASGALP